jgi:hypothetical protein
MTALDLRVLACVTQSAWLVSYLFAMAEEHSQDWLCQLSPVFCKRC